MWREIRAEAPRRPAAAQCRGKLGRKSLTWVPGVFDRAKALAAGGGEGGGGFEERPHFSTHWAASLGSSVRTEQGKRCNHARLASDPGAPGATIICPVLGMGRNGVEPSAISRGHRSPSDPREPEGGADRERGLLGAGVGFLSSRGRLPAWLPPCPAAREPRNVPASGNAPASMR